MWAWLPYREGLLVNKKRVYRLRREAGLTITRGPHVATRTPKAKPQATRPRQDWGIDRTTFLLAPLGWVYLVLVLDWYTKKIVGWDLSLRSRRQEWEAAVMRGGQAECPQGVRGAGVKLVSDNGSQPTATGCLAAMGTLGIEPVVTSYDNPKGNAETERLMRTIKEAWLWLREFRTLDEARDAIPHGITVDDPRHAVQSTLGDQSPLECDAACSRQGAAHAAAEADSRSAPEEVS